MNDILVVAEKFQIEGAPVTAEAHHSGHIHSSYLVGTTHKQYLLQRINQHVFPQPDSLMANILKVTEHIRTKAADLGREPARATIMPVPTYGSHFLYRDETGGFWRAFEFIVDTETFTIPQSGGHVYQAGRAMGDFLGYLADLDPTVLTETIPNFHHTPTRFAHFVQRVNADRVGRAAEAAAEIEFVLARKVDAARVVDLLERGALPNRVTHNDTKISNVLFDRQSGEAVCLIDLDTVMPGSPLYDFGDAVRTMANTAAEDEPDVDLVDIDLTYFTQLTNGFLERARGMLSPREVELLPFSAILMTLECGLRFLDDYLDGDRYFHISRAHHNLERARVQFRLVEKMEARLDAMQDAVARAVA